MCATETKTRWYILHTYSGQEERVKKNLDLRITAMDMSKKILEVVVPSEQEIEIKGGEKVPKQNKIFPGYVIVHMVMDEESWHVARNTPGVTGFISVEDEYDKRPRPVPLEEEEIRAILDRVSSPVARVTGAFELGDAVRIVDGPFAEFMGTVDEINDDRGKIRVLVSFFGRETPVDLDFLQIEKL